MKLGNGAIYRLRRMSYRLARLAAQLPKNLSAEAIDLKKASRACEIAADAIQNEREES